VSFRKTYEPYDISKHHHTNRDNQRVLKGPLILFQKHFEWPCTITSVGTIFDSSISNRGSRLGGDGIVMYCITCLSSLMASTMQYGKLDQNYTIVQSSRILVQIILSTKEKL